MSFERGRLSGGDQTMITNRVRRAAYKVGTRVQKKGTSDVARKHWRRIPPDVQVTIRQIGESYDPSVSDAKKGQMHRNGAAILHGLVIGSLFGRKLASGYDERQHFYTSLDQLLRGQYLRGEFAGAQAAETLARNGGAFADLIRNDIDTALVMLHKPLLDVDGNNYAYDHVVRSLYSHAVGYVAAIGVNSQVESVMSVRQNTVSRRFGFDSGYSAIRADAEALAAGETALDTMGVALFMPTDETSLPIEEPRAEE